MSRLHEAALDEKVALRAILERRSNVSRGFSPHVPFPKQQQFLDLTCPEALYGGAAGGGKSDALAMCCLKWAAQPNFAALILRRTHKELIKAGALMDRFHDWLDGTEAHWSAGDKRWSFPTGSTIEFGYFDHYSDRNQYQSAQWNLICFDELTHFPEPWYQFMFTRIRRTMNSKIPSMMRSATNPGNIGHEWVQRRFMTETHPDRVFIPANFKDNPFNDHEDYERNLNLADQITRRQMLGEWVHDGTGLVYREFSKKNLIDQAPPRLDYYLLGLDFGIVDDNAITVLGWKDHDPTIYVVESYRKKALVHELSTEVLKLDAKYKFVRMVGDTGGQGKAFTEDMRQRKHIPVEAAEKQNKVGYIRLLNDDLARTRVRIVAPTCQDLLSEWRELFWDETGMKEIGSALNHASDSMLYAWRAATAFAEQPEEQPAPGTVKGIQKAVELAHQKQWDTMPKEDQEIWGGREEQSKKQWWENGF